MQAKICHISTVHPVKDIRIFTKECRSLYNAGFQVFYVATHSHDEVIDGVNIVALPDAPSRVKRMLFKPFIAFRRALKTGAVLYHFHDPELMPIGWLLRLCGKKVIYDAHENLSKDILDKPWIKSLVLRKGISRIAGWAEQFSYLALSGVVCATDNIYQQFGKRKSVLVRNLPILKMIDGVSASTTQRNAKNILIFAGGLTRIRGTVEMVTAMNLLPDDFELWIAGSFDDKELLDECKANPGWKRCKYYGHVEQQQAYALMKAADAGLLTYLPAANHMEAMPNKPFEYMSCSLPMILSDFPFWRMLFGNAAVYVDPASPASIAEGIKNLFEDTDKRRNRGVQGRELIDNNLSWEAEEKVLIGFYNKVLSKQ